MALPALALLVASEEQCRLAALGVVAMGLLATRSASTSASEILLAHALTLHNGVLGSLLQRLPAVPEPSGTEAPFALGAPVVRVVVWGFASSAQ